MKKIKKKEEKYWKTIDEKANRQCITCKFCFPEIRDDIENENYIYDYSKCVCTGEYYGKNLTENDLMSYPDCWSLSLDEYIRIAGRLEEKGIVDPV